MPGREWIAALLACVTLAAGAPHPGNVFVEGEDVVVPAPDSARWNALDDRGTVLASGAAEGGDANAELGKLGVGWYEIRFLDAEGGQLGRTTAAVLSKPMAPVDRDSPICLDVALSWNEQDRQCQTRLAALAGVSWVRDRMRWREVQTGPGQFVAHTQYDESAGMQARAGLKVLQVFHQSPAWAVDSEEERARFPSDLRIVHAFCKEMAARFKGRVQAWEPWNEANAGNFGGHAIDEMCSMQKAAYLGFKAGAPDVIVGWNPIGGINTEPLAKGILDNETWPYYDTYNIHSYDWPHAYDELWTHARVAACGRPIWVTECDRGLAALEGSPNGDFSRENALRKAEFMAQSYAHSLHAGAARHFHFILGHYMEGHGGNAIQFGLLRKDLGPRPSYVALAALGRLLAGTKCRGRWPLALPAHAFAFGGAERDVLVAWAEEDVDWPSRGSARAGWYLPEGLEVTEVFDYLGRSLGAAVPRQLTPAAIFVLMPPGEALELPLEKPPLSPRREGEPSPIVLQLDIPEGHIVRHDNGWTQEHEREIAAARETELVLYAHNFGREHVQGSVTVESAPETWAIVPRHFDIALGPMERRTLCTRLQIPPGEAPRYLSFRGDFGEAGRPVLAFRITPTPSTSHPVL